MTNIYYVYVAWLSGAPRYVGFGHGNRFEHVNSGTSHVRILNEMVLKYEKTFEIEFLEDGLTQEAAQEREQFYIKKFGRVDLNEGLLWNETNGGIGFSGGHTQESKDKIQKASTKMWEKLDQTERKKRIDRFLSVGKNTRFQKGRPSNNAKTYKIYENNALIFKGSWKECIQRYPDKEGSLLNLKGKPEFVSIRGKCKGWKVIPC